MKSFSRKPPRWQDENSLYFLTFCTYNRQKILHTNQIPEFLIKELLFYSDKISNLMAYTIMPDHIHLMVETKTVLSMSSFLRDFKKFTSNEIKQYSTDKYVWQRGTMDHCIRPSLENQDFENHICYLFSNSWKHLGIRPKDYPYHNFKDMVDKGWLELEFFDYDAPKEFNIYM